MAIRYLDPDYDFHMQATLLPLMGDYTYFDLAQQLKQGEVLVGVYDRGGFVFCPVITNNQDYEMWRGQYKSFLIVTRKHYAVRAERIVAAAELYGVH